MRYSAQGWQRRIVFTGVALIASLTVASVPAVASNFGTSGQAGTSGTTNGVWLTNNLAFIVGLRNLTTASAAGVANVEDTFDSTDLSFSDSAVSSCPDSSYDVCVYDANYGDNGLRGWNACAGTTTGQHQAQVCSLAWVRFNTTYSSNKTNLACHELGHSVGLRHESHAASCMQTPLSGTLTLNAHDKDQINFTYG